MVLALLYMRQCGTSNTTFIYSHLRMLKPDFYTTGNWFVKTGYLPAYVTSHVTWLIVSTGICIYISAYGTEVSS